MLTRLKVNGFKNLVDVDVRFGPFTCIAGPNGVGKSNLFDAIRFLSALAQYPLMQAAKSIRDEKGRTTDVQSLFQRKGEKFGDRMEFEVEMIVPSSAVDDLGQPVQVGNLGKSGITEKIKGSGHGSAAKTTFLKYRLALEYRDNEYGGLLQIAEEELSPIKIGDAKTILLFDHSKGWQNTAVRGRAVTEFISTDTKEGTVKRHQDGVGGRVLRFTASSLTSTVLSSVNASESPTALLAKREMMSWDLLQLEPSALRQPDKLDAPTILGMDGSHLPATLYYLARQHSKNSKNEGSNGSAVYAQMTNRLAELLGDVSDVSINRDDKSDLLTLMVTDKNSVTHPARALSDGTLRFIALSVLELDTRPRGMLCLEEPENGIHPARIPHILKLLEDIATDPQLEVDETNPLQQVIINTHSPGVVLQVPDDSLLVAESQEEVSKDGRFIKAVFTCLENTWRAEVLGCKTTSRGKLLSYLNPVEDYPEDSTQSNVTQRGTLQKTKRRVIDNLYDGQISLNENPKFLQAI